MPGQEWVCPPSRQLTGAAQIMGTQQLPQPNHSYHTPSFVESLPQNTHSAQQANPQDAHALSAVAAAAGGGGP
jgi:hypothetical protein